MRGMVGVGTEEQKKLVNEVEDLTGLTFDQIKVILKFALQSIRL
jgi:hypothetical protein